MKPIVNAILLADHVHRDRTTGKMTILGTFNIVQFAEFPGRHGGSFIFVNISNFHGTHKLHFRFTRVSDGKQLAVSDPATIKHDDRLRACELAIRLPVMKFEHPGQYGIELLWDGEWLAAVKIQALRLKGKRQ